MPRLILFTGLVLLLFGVIPFTALAAKPIPKAVPQVLHMDTSKLQLRVFNEKAIQGYLKSKDFQYHDDAPAGLSWWAMFWRWVWNIITNIIDKILHGDHTWVLLKYFLLLLAVGFIVYIIFKISGIDIIRIWRGNASKVNIPYSESLENIHQINFDDEIEHAIANRNYRLAVRLLYLRSLKQLNDLQLIHWQIDKTNATYLNELRDEGQRRSFGLLTKQFEYVWYGDFAVDAQAFQNISVLFQDFKNRLA